MSATKAEHGDMFFSASTNTTHLLFILKVGTKRHEMWLQLDTLDTFDVTGEGTDSFYHFDQSHYVYIGKVKDLAKSISVSMQEKLK